MMGPEKIIEMINAIPDNTVIKPNLPIAVAVQEAENLHSWCQDDREELIHAGLDWNLVENIPDRAYQCRSAESVWLNDYMRGKDVEKLWKIKSRLGHEMRVTIVHHYMLAFRQNSLLLGKVRKANKRNSHTFIIQALSDLAILGEGYTEMLDKVNFDVDLLSQARQLADELGDLYGQVTSKRYDRNENKIFRDKAYTWLKTAVDEIRLYGQFVFWKNPERKKGYICQYHIKKRKKRHSREIA